MVLKLSGLENLPYTVISKGGRGPAGGMLSRAKFFFSSLSASRTSNLIIFNVSVSLNRISPFIKIVLICEGTYFPVQILRVSIRFP